MKKIIKIVSFMLVLSLTLGLTSISVFSDDPEEEVVPGNDGPAQVFYFTDLMCPLVYPSMIESISDGRYQITYYSGNVWDTILSNFTSSEPEHDDVDDAAFHQLFCAGESDSGWSVLNTGENFENPTDNFPGAGSLIIIELRNYFADGQKLDILYEQLKNAGYKVAMVSGYYSSQYNTQDFREHLDDFTLFWNFSNYIKSVVADINTYYSGINNATFYLDARLIPGFLGENDEPTMTFAEAYSESEFLFHFIYALGCIDTSVSVISDFLSTRNIKILVYGNNGTFHYLFGAPQGGETTLPNYVMPNEALHYVIGFTPLEEDFYSYLWSYQEDYRHTNDSGTDAVAPIYVYGAFRDYNDVPLIIRVPDPVTNDSNVGGVDPISLEQYVALLGQIFNGE